VGCSPPIYCAPCPQRAHGGFHPATGITICQNHVPTVRRMESTLAHEMVHAFDECRFKVDYRNIKHVACGEVHNILHGLI
jgi:inner membrane protease ATP23